MENFQNGNTSGKQQVLAMYDVRGIQNYIYRTPHIKDAMGASGMVENIIFRALRHACKKLDIWDYLIEWDDANTVYEYKPSEEHDVVVLYIGGGNALVTYRDEELCKKVNCQMARYILKETYSLQLATAYVNVTGNYSKDYENLFKKMSAVKANMTSSMPYGALPVVKTELRTGLAAVETQVDQNRVDISTETRLKLQNKYRQNEENDIDKILDSYAFRGTNSRIAVVHIDGNNMGLRIRSLIDQIKDYGEAVNKMRSISHQIRYSYLNTFNSMKKHFEESYGGDESIKRFVRKIIVAGDDITYVCNAYIALETVRYFSEKISGLTMNKLSGEETEENIRKYGFSVCAGIAYIGSHFPFSTAYEVAESCCESAKKAAKQEEHKDGDRIGNYVDFQICKNIQCRDLERIRREEFITPTGEDLLQRPYYIPTKYQYGLSKNAGKFNDYAELVKIIQYFETKIPRSFAKDIRNTYPLGKHQMKQLEGFLQSRGWKMPGNFGMYDESGNRALWYDALEIMDYNLFPEEKEGVK